jgi:hypothetical protein
LEIAARDPASLRRAAARAANEIEVLQAMGYQVRGLKIRGYLLRTRKEREL